jgi:hypothetical protein
VQCHFSLFQNFGIRKGTHKGNIKEMGKILKVLREEATDKDLGNDKKKH